MKIHVILFILSVLLISCEDVVDSQELPYIEELVIRGILEEGKPLQGLTITRTLPPLEEYSIEKATVRNADAFISYKNVKYKLSYDSATNTYFSKELPVESQGVYHLAVKWQGLQASAETRIPEPIEIDSFSLRGRFVKADRGGDHWEYDLIANFIPKAKSAYAAFIKEQFSDYYTYYTSYRTRDTLKNGNMALPVYNIWLYNNEDAEIFFVSNNYMCYIDCYDEPFYNYFLSRYNGGSDGDIFGTSGTNIKGNIKGGIGLFLGFSRASKKVSF